jgi:two-component system response regulator YesN
LNIVVVDDERVIRQGLKKIIQLSSPQYKVVGEASDGQEAFELLRKGQCELLITDIRMPIMDGLELIEKARKLNPVLEIVILSG